MRDGSGWLEIQVDPTSYAPRLGGLIPALEIILDAVRAASRETGLGIRVLVAANRMKHPWTPVRSPGWPSATPTRA